MKRCHSVKYDRMEIFKKSFLTLKLWKFITKIVFELRLLHNQKKYQGSKIFQSHQMTNNKSSNFIYLIICKIVINLDKKTDAPINLKGTLGRARSWKKFCKDWSFCLYLWSSHGFSKELQEIIFCIFFKLIIRVKKLFFSKLIICNYRGIIQVSKTGPRFAVQSLFPEILMIKDKRIIFFSTTDNSAKNCRTEIF